jgi:hypothetical protein
MKKLLLILLCVPLLFTTCKKEDDTLGTGNFLENNDGNVYYYADNLDPGEGIPDTIGFYNATSFLVIKQEGNCGYLIEGNNPGGDGDFDVDIIENSNSKFVIEFTQISEPTWRYEFIPEGNNSILLNIEINNTLYYTIPYSKSSTETNLSCN